MFLKSEKKRKNVFSNTDSNLCEKHTWTSRTDGRTDRRLTVA